jgi:hypothetical protein
MPTVHLEAQLSTEELLKAVDQLSPAELTQFVARVLALHAQRNAPALPPDEADLLRKIEQGIPADLHDRYEVLIARRRAAALTQEEHDELLRLTDQVEALEAQRAEHLASLARLRGVSLAELLDELGIRAPEYE